VFCMARPRTSSRFMMLHQRSPSLLLFLENACHRSSYIPIAQNIESRGFVSYAISCYYIRCKQIYRQKIYVNIHAASIARCIAIADGSVYGMCQSHGSSPGYCHILLTPGGVVTFIGGHVMTQY
jgi:hypothetical protein